MRDPFDFDISIVAQIYRYYDSDDYDTDDPLRRKPIIDGQGYFGWVLVLAPETRLARPSNGI